MALVLKSIPIREYPCGCWTLLDSPHRIHLCLTHSFEKNRTDDVYWLMTEIKITQKAILELE